MQLPQGVAGIRTTHNPAVMLAHDKHGYPDDFVSVDEPNKALSAIRILLNPDVNESDLVNWKSPMSSDLNISLNLGEQIMTYWLFRQFRRDTFKKCCEEPRDSLTRREGHCWRLDYHWETYRSASGIRIGVGARMTLTTLKNS